MQFTKKNFILLLFFLICNFSVSSNMAIAEDVPLVDGKLWRISSKIEKKSFLIGASNLLSIEYTYQIKGKNPPTDKQSIIPRFYKNIDDVTLDQAIDKIDQWYQDNPDKLNEPVLAVIWLSMVEPNL